MKITGLFSYEKKKNENCKFVIKTVGNYYPFEWNFINLGDIVYCVGFILPSDNILFVKIPSTYVAVVIDTEILLLMLWLLLSKIFFIKILK